MVGVRALGLHIEGLEFKTHKPQQFFSFDVTNSIFRLVLKVFNYHYDYIDHKIKCRSFIVQFLNNTCIFLAFRKILGISHFLTKNIIR